MKTSKDPRGGARAGSGRKKDETKPKKKPYTVSLLPEQHAAIMAAHGSLTRAIKASIPTDTAQ